MQDRLGRQIQAKKTNEREIIVDKLLEPISEREVECGGLPGQWE